MFFAGALMALAGCTVAPGDIPPGLGPVAPDKGGIVFGTIGRGGSSAYTSQGLRYRMQGREDTALIAFRDSGIVDTPVDFEEGTAKGSLFLIRLPPGAYELMNIHFFINRGQFGTTTFSAKEDFSIAFTVKEGTATYLGEFLGYQVTGKNFFGWSVPAGGYFVIRNQIERDFSLARKKGVTLPRERVEVSVADPKAVGSPMIRERADIP
jgi:hypothetical protein